MKKECWMQQRKHADFTALSKRFGIDPVIARVIRNRGVIGEEEMERYLHGGWESLHDPHQMKDAKKAAEWIAAYIKSGKKIGIASDFDNDGIFSGMILYEGIQNLGGQAAIYTPHRIYEGYGINKTIVDRAINEGCELLMTCDNGIAAFEAADYAKECGLCYIITDHHEIPYELADGEKKYKLPTADAIVNPHQEDCAYPYKELCGTGVAYKVMQLVYELFQRPSEEMTAFLEYVAIATVADVMELTGENRILVKEGLKRLNATDSIGLKALIKANGLIPGTIGSYQIGFVLGPCFNAAGRLDTIEHALKLLKSTTEAEAEQYAHKLKVMNDERKNMTEQGVRDALEQIEQAEWKDAPVYVIYLPDCHESIVGIIAGRIRERYSRPVIVFANALEDAFIKGSGRSIEAYHMYEELSKHRDKMERFGGHKMAAGLTIRKEKLEAFRAALNQTCTLTPKDLIPVVRIDVAMPIGYITEKLVEDLDCLEPFGRGNERPLFAQAHVSVLDIRILGKNQNVLKLQVADDRHCVMDALYFQNAELMLSDLEEEYGEKKIKEALSGRGRDIDLAITYYPQINEYGDRRTLQIVIQNYCRILPK